MNVEGLGIEKKEKKEKGLSCEYIHNIVFGLLL